MSEVPRDRTFLDINSPGDIFVTSFDESGALKEFSCIDISKVVEPGAKIGEDTVFAGILETGIGDIIVLDDALETETGDIIVLDDALEAETGIGCIIALAACRYGKPKIT